VSENLNKVILFDFFVKSRAVIEKMNKNPITENKINLIKYIEVIQKNIKILLKIIIKIKEHNNINTIGKMKRNAIRNTKFNHLGGNEQKIVKYMNKINNINNIN